MPVVVEDVIRGRLAAYHDSLHDQDQQKAEDHAELWQWILEEQYKNMK